MNGWIADLLVLLGLTVMTLGVVGVFRFPDVYTQLHASSKAAFLGVSLLLVAACFEGNGPVIARVVLIVALLALTTPVASHAIAQAAHHRGEVMRSGDALDESASFTGPETAVDRAESGE